jgi:hypothetical protein
MSATQRVLFTYLFVQFLFSESGDMDYSISSFCKEIV